MRHRLAARASATRRRMLTAAAGTPSACRCGSATMPQPHRTRASVRCVEPCRSVSPYASHCSPRPAARRPLPPRRPHRRQRCGPRRTGPWPHPTPKDWTRACSRSLDAEFAAGGHGYIGRHAWSSRHGRLVFERGYIARATRRSSPGNRIRPGALNYYDPDWHPYRDGDLHTMQSVSKSVTSALVGIAVGRGEIPGVQVKMTPYFADFRFRSDREKVGRHDAGARPDDDHRHQVGRVHDHLHQSGEQRRRMEKSDDWIQFVLDQPMAADPGQSFVSTAAPPSCCRI